MYANHISLTSIVQFDQIILMVFIYIYFNGIYVAEMMHFIIVVFASR